MTNRKYFNRGSKSVKAFFMLNRELQRIEPKFKKKNLNNPYSSCDIFEKNVGFYKTSLHTFNWSSR